MPTMPRLVRTPRSRRPYNPAAEVPGARYRTSGSLIGLLGQIQIANRREFRLYDRHSDWATVVTADPGFRNTLTSALGELVIASGELWSDERDHPLQLEVTELEVIDSKDRGRLHLRLLRNVQPGR